MRHDEQNIEANESALPDLLSALLNQWDGDVVEVEELVEASPLEVIGNAAPELPQAKLQQAQWWQIPPSPFPVLDRSEAPELTTESLARREDSADTADSADSADTAVDSLLAQLNAEYDELNSVATHPPVETAELPLEVSDSLPDYGLDTLLAQLNAQYDEPVSVDAAEAVELEPPFVPASMQPALETESAPGDESADLASMAYTIDKVDSATKLRYIHFWMAEKSFAIPINQVVESGRLTEVAPLPCVNEAIRGLINLHGEIVPLLDLRSLLGNIHGNCLTEEKMLIVRTGNSEGACGLAVDRVSGMLALDPNEFRSFAPADTDLAGAFINGFCDRQGSLIRLLDLERLFDSLSGKVASATEPIQDQPGRRYSDV